MHEINIYQDDHEDKKITLIEFGLFLVRRVPELANLPCITRFNSGSTIVPITTAPQISIDGNYVANNLTFKQIGRMGEYVFYQCSHPGMPEPNDYLILTQEAHASISRVHMLIVFEDNKKIILQDCNSKNGSFLNNQKFEQYYIVINGKYQLRLGNVEFIFKIS